MYRSIYVPVDNSELSNRAIEQAIELGKAFESTLIGSHVYPARMHEYRFKQMEYSLPEEYLEETELERQRKIHDSLITMGLKLISESYMEPMKKRCKAEGLAFEAKMIDGKHHVELVKDIRASRYDLVVIGALGIGRGRDSQIGSVCERLAHEIDRDVWIVKHLPEPDAEPRDTILVCIDGSPQSFGALNEAITLAKIFEKKVECIAVYDPYLHYSVFNGLVGILTEKASEVFRFEEQNQLHEEIIDTGLAQIYQSHLNVAGTIAAEQGVEISKTLLDGKAFQKILDHARDSKPWLLVLGRIGVHSSKDEIHLGSNTDNLLRLSPCDVLITTGLYTPKIDLQAEQSVRWTKEAEQRMTRIPEQVRGIARTAILRLAMEKGHSMITSSLLSEAMDLFMPKQMGGPTLKLAEALAIDRVRNEPVSVCKRCAVTAREPNPVKCSVCGATEFELITPEMIDEIARMEGGIEEEIAYDGRKLRWSRGAREALEAIADKYQQRRARARIEKSARGNKASVITLEFCRKVIEEETGKPLAPFEAQPINGSAEQSTAAAESAPEMFIAAVDPGGVALVSIYRWTSEATARILRVPSGFMRNKTQSRVEELAAERDAETIDLELVEAGIESGRKMMEEMVADYKAQVAGAASADAGAEEECPAAGESDPIAEGESGAETRSEQTYTMNEVGTIPGTPRAQGS